jgi:hypothetical protein
MRVQDIAGGMLLLLNYYNQPHGYHASAEHDELRMAATDQPLTPEDVAKMIEFGWHQEHAERDYGEEFAPKDYRQDEDWVSYV